MKRNALPPNIACCHFGSVHFHVHLRLKPTGKLSVSAGSMTRWDIAVVYNALACHSSCHYWNIMRSFSLCFLFLHLLFLGMQAFMLLSHLRQDVEASVYYEGMNSDLSSIMQSFSKACCTCADNKVKPFAVTLHNTLKVGRKVAHLTGFFYGKFWFHHGGLAMFAISYKCVACTSYVFFRSLDLPCIGHWGCPLVQNFLPFFYLGKNLNVDWMKFVQKMAWVQLHASDCASHWSANRRQTSMHQRQLPTKFHWAKQHGCIHDCHNKCAKKEKQPSEHLALLHDSWIIHTQEE